MTKKQRRDLQLFIVELTNEGNHAAAQEVLQLLQADWHKRHQA